MYLKKKISKLNLLKIITLHTTKICIIFKSIIENILKKLHSKIKKKLFCLRSSKIIFSLIMYFQDSVGFRKDYF